MLLCVMVLQIKSVRCEEMESEKIKEIEKSEFEKMMENEFTVNRIWSFNDKKTSLTHVEINDKLLTESEIKKITEIKEKFNFKTYNIFAYEKMLITFYIF